ncbi:MAG: nucleotidyltransferase domain-containing protein [Bacteroidetes bacterium]|nr:nucleotidyltransferase domain-containing protein [Bacteroidota bacterium]
MPTREQAIEQVKSFLKDCKSIGLDIKKTIMFGSAAKDEMNEWSDIDIMLVSDNFTLNTFENIRKYSRININYPDIETHPFPTNYFIESDPFIEEIKRTGIEINSD